jgi:predicted peptidase
MGAPQGYVEYLPPGYGDKAKRPLLLYLHGSGEDGNGSRAALRKVLATGIPKLIAQDKWPAARPFIVLAPQHAAARPGGPATCPSPAEIARFLAFATKHYDVDPTRVYLTGVSCGAIGGWNYLGEHTDDLVAAAVLIAGDGQEAFQRAGCRLGKVPLWIFTGSADPIVDSRLGSIGVMRQLQVCTHPKPVDARLTVYPGVGHDSWDRTYDLSAGHDVYAWLLTYQHP